MKGPTRASVAGRTYLDLQNKARREKRPTQELLNLYVLERFLVRLAGGEDRDSLILKSGALLAAFGTRRPARDVDFLAVDIASDTDVVLAMMRRIAGIELDDGVVFDVAGTTAHTVRDEDVYSGVRVSMRRVLAQALVIFHIDVSVGDPLWPAPEMVELPGLLEGSAQLRVTRSRRSWMTALRAWATSRVAPPHAGSVDLRGGGCEPVPARSDHR